MLAPYINLAAASLAMLKEYKQNVHHTLQSTNASEELRTQILTDLYALDNVYFSLNRKYQTASRTFSDFCKTHNLHTELRNLFPAFQRHQLYVHQEVAIESILAGKTTIIATGTGSGKTEAFLIPILDHCLKNRGNKGIKAIILYPMNALANDQLRRIEEDDALKRAGLTVRSFIGSTLKEDREAMKSDPPDILVTNYIMLDRLLTKYNVLFQISAHTLRYLVIDEIHYYRGSKGANLSLLLRRLRPHCKDQNQLIQIGASATLQQGGEYYRNQDREQIENFARAIFGMRTVANFSFITPVYAEKEIGEGGQSSQLLTAIDQIEGESLVSHGDEKAICSLVEQFVGQPLPQSPVSRWQRIYQFIQEDLFVYTLREELQATHDKQTEEIGEKQPRRTIIDFIELFSRLYHEQYQREPRDAESVVYAYLSIINYLNYHYAVGNSHIPHAILDYRMHLMLSNLGGRLSRCLHCGHYSDGRRSRCRLCNGLLFSISKQHLTLCLAKSDGAAIWPITSYSASEGKNVFPVLVQRIDDTPVPEESTEVFFSLEETWNREYERAYYALHPTRDHTNVVRIVGIATEEQQEELLLEHPRLYWINVHRVVDALLSKPSTQIASKLLGFIDNRERASGIRFRLRDEIADRVLTEQGYEEWSKLGEISLPEAYLSLTRKDFPDKGLCAEVGREVPFWFARMLTRLPDYEASWAVVLNSERSDSCCGEALELIHQIFLKQGAIDRSAFPTPVTHHLQHFYLEKYRVETEYGVGIEGVQEQGYNIISLGKEGEKYKEYIQRVGSERIQEILSDLQSKGIITCKKTRQGKTYYQVNPEMLVLNCSKGGESQHTYAENPPLVECHTADNSDVERAEAEEKFRTGDIHVLICTPTLEMGVDIGDLTSVMMIGFPPSPASYAQRAGRAGRKGLVRSAAIVTIASSGDSHDEYYMANPLKMIEGTITPPQFTLTNLKLLVPHTYAYLLAGQENLPLLKDYDRFTARLQHFFTRDEMNLRQEIGEVYEALATYLRQDVHHWLGTISHHEQAYREGLFPDYGFRRDGVPLIDASQASPAKEKVLTFREPEMAARQLAPGRIVYCGGKPVKVAERQPFDSYTIEYDPEHHPYRSPQYMQADLLEEKYLYAHRDPDERYKLKRMLLCKGALVDLPAVGPSYCRIYLVHQGKIHIINEGIRNKEGKSLQPFQEGSNQYRFGTSLVRDGLLVYLSSHILSQDTRANFLAVLLWAIPHYFNLDDSELRILSDVALYTEAGDIKGEEDYYFIYGQDESGAVPFPGIFENLHGMLQRYLEQQKDHICSSFSTQSQEPVATLAHASNQTSSCYHCLLSLNSRYLAGILSLKDAQVFLRSYLQQSLLQPYLPAQKSALARPDLLLSIEWKGTCQISATNRLAPVHDKQYTFPQQHADQNTSIYDGIRTVLLEQLASSNVRTVKMVCKPAYIADHLNSENKVNKGSQAYFQLKLALQQYEAWTAERMQ